MSSKEKKISNHEKVCIIILVLISSLEFIQNKGLHTIFHWTTTADIPAILRILNKDYLTNDFYTNATTDSPKLFYIYFILFPTLLGIKYYKILFLWKVILVISTKAIIYFTTITIINNWKKYYKDLFVNKTLYSIIFF